MKEADVAAMNLALEALEDLKGMFVQVQILGLRTGRSATEMRVGEEHIHDRAIINLRERIAVHNEAQG